MTLHVLRSTALLLALSVLLAACQHLPAADTHYTQAEQIHHWIISGRLGYRTAHDGGSASFTWRQAPRHGRIHFSGPFGFGSAELAWRPGLAILKTGDGTYQARSPGELAWRLTGFWLPVSALEYWSRGLAWPGAPARESRGPKGNLTGLQQLGWTLKFSEYRKVGQVPLPHRIRATRDDNRFTLLIQDWRPLSAVRQP